MSKAEERRPGSYITPAGAWAFSLGTSIGWGSLVITSSTYLSQAGPAGSVLGLLLGAAVMLVIARNYHYMISCYPESGGAYTFARDVFGYDYGFLTGWFLALTYFAMLWANATSLPLFAKYFIGGMFERGYLYTVFQYRVYLGEALLSAAAIALAALLCVRSRKGVAAVMTVLAVLFSAGILICFLGGMIRGGQVPAPAFIPDRNQLGQVLRIACISPWAFIGFECISHATEEYAFERRKVFGILAAAVISATVLYAGVTLLSVSAYPPEYDSWPAYIRDLGNLEGIKGLPAFYAAYTYLGNAGLFLLMLVLLALIVSSLLGNLFVLSRLFRALALDGIVPRRIGDLNEKGLPSKAVMLAACISMVVPFIGRTAIGWIVDVTTLGATLIYGFVSAATLKTARDHQNPAERVTGWIGLGAMLVVGAYLLLPNLFGAGSMASESYILFVVWAILGFIFFRHILRKDTTRRFGKSIVVWIALLSLILFTSLVWMSQSTLEATDRAMENVQEHYYEAGYTEGDSAFIEEEIRAIRYTNARSIVIVVGLFAVSLGVLLNNYSIMSRRAQESEEQLGRVRNLANTDPLTGVKSKHAYTETVRQIDGEIAAGNSEAFSLVFCDVNGLKHINDTLGHKAGDALICSAASMICELFQHSPVFRIGGDEFVVILKGRDYQNRLEIMKALHKKSEDGIRTGEAVVSAGLADFIPGKDSSFQTVYERADALMYERKKELKGMGAATRL